jgi:hypothetical protein
LIAESSGRRVRNSSIRSRGGRNEGGNWYLIDKNLRLTVKYKGVETTAKATLYSWLIWKSGPVKVWVFILGSYKDRQKIKATGVSV